MSELLGIPISDLTPWGIVTMFVLMVAAGLLVPRWVLNTIKEELRARVQDALLWKKVAEERGVTIDKLTTLLIEQTELSETSAHVLQALRGQRGGEEDGEVAAQAGEPRGRGSAAADHGRGRRRAR